MRRSVLLVTLAAIASCGGSQQTHSSGPATPRPPSVGPRAEDGIDDHGLADAAADVNGRTGEDLARAQTRLLTSQTRAFIVAVAHALPRQSAPAPSSAADSPAPGASSSAPAAVASSNSPAPSEASAPRFDPPSTLIQQLEATAECGNGGVAHTCAARLGNALLSRIDALRPPSDLEQVKFGLLSALAALEESRVVIQTDVRWRVLTQGEDPAAHLTQALTLLLITRHVAQAIAINCPCEETAHLAARISDDLAIGACSDAFERLIGPDGTPAADPRPGLAALANAGCAPACARPALTGASDDVVGDAARACRGESDVIAFSPFADATRAVAEWVRSARTRLESVTNDPAVSALLAARVGITNIGVLPLPPPLFRAGGGAAIDVPAVANPAGNGLEMGSASALVWVPPTGEVTVTAAQQFSLEPEPPVTPRSTALDGLATVLADLARPAREGAERAPVALILDRGVRGSRAVALLAQLAHEPAAGAQASEPLVGIAVRNGPYSRYVPLRLVSNAAGTVFRVGERQIIVTEPATTPRVIALTPPAAGAADRLSGAVPEAAPSGPFTLVLEADVTGATIARVADALTVYGGRASTPIVPGIVSSVGSDAVLFGTIAEARATALRAAIESHRADATHCLESVASTPDALAPRVDLHLVLDARGRITRADATGDAPRTDAAVTCVTTAARRWRLPATGAAIEVRVPFVLDRP